jgi:hypothetical protein
MNLRTKSTKKKPKRPVVMFRGAPRDFVRLTKLKDKLELQTSAVIRIALRELAIRQGVE